MADLTVIADYNDLCGECPIWDPNSSSLYWTDIAGYKFYRYHWQSRRHELLHEGLEINGFRLNRSGGFVITNSQGFWMWNGTTKTVLLTDRVDGAECRVNDCIADPVGRLYAGTCFYDPNGPYELGKLIRVDTDGTAVVVDEGFDLANGFGFSPDNSTLYFTDSGTRTIYAYDYIRGTGEIKNRRVFVKVPDTEGLPDGMTVDSEGFVWSAQWFGSRVVRYDPEGQVERRIDVPAKQTSAITFGGDDLTDIFITSAGKYSSLPIMPPGYDPDSGYLGGKLFQLNLGIQGKFEYMTAISPRSQAH